MRTQVVSIAGKEVIVNERRVGELKELVAKILPETGGNLANFRIEQLMSLDVSDVLYKKLPEVFPGLEEKDVDNAYPSEIEALVEAFIDVHFFGLKKLIQPLMTLAQAGVGMPSTPAAPPPRSQRAGTTRKR